MTSSGSPTCPPRVLAWLVELFASPQEADGILGDLTEEFNANTAQHGADDARRIYRREACRTISDLMRSPLRIGQSSGVAAAASGLAASAAIGLAGLIMTWPIGMAVNMALRMRVVHTLVYAHLPAPLVPPGFELLGVLLTGVFAALVSRWIGVRPMNAALAIVAMMGVLFAVDLPVAVWLFGPPMRRVTLALYLMRWLRGVTMFGGMIVVGAALGRMVQFRERSAAHQPSVQ